MVNVLCLNIKKKLFNNRIDKFQIFNGQSNQNSLDLYGQFLNL